MKLRNFALVGFCALMLSGTASADIVVVGSKDMPQITEKLAKKIFLKKIAKLPNGMEVTPLDLAGDEDTKWTFYKKVVKKKPSQVHAYWSRALFSGLGNPPDQVSDVSELKERLNEPGVIGYIHADQLDSGMNVLLRIST